MKLKKGRTPAIAKYNELRSALKDFFVDRQMFCFPVPTLKQEDLNNLDNLRVEDLDKRFIKVGDTFTEFVLTQNKEKTIRGKTINGSIFATLTKQYVDAVKKGNINIESSFEYVLQSENRKAVENAVSEFNAEVNKLEFPVSVEELTSAAKVGEDKANKRFLQTSILTSDEGRMFLKELEAKS